MIVYSGNKQLRRVAGRSIFITLVLLVIIANNFVALAQNNGGRSYSVFNIGDLQASASAVGSSRAGIESSINLPTSINSINPALWGSLNSVTLHTGLIFEQFKVSDNQSSILQNNTKLQNFSLGVPYWDKYGAGFALVVKPYSTVSYLNQNEGSVIIDTTKTKTLTQFSGEGGLTVIMFGTSFKPIPMLALGLAANKYFGEIYSSAKLTFPDNSTLNGADYISSAYYKGWGASFGAVLKPIENLSLGAVYETGGTLNRELTNVILRYNGRVIDAGRNQYLEDVYDTTLKTTSEYVIPPKYIFGGTYQTGRVAASAEYSLQDWTNQTQPNATNSNRIALGIDYLASTNLSSSGLDRWGFRLGGFTEKTYYKINGKDINCNAFTLGATIPLTRLTALNSGIVMDISSELGSRGSTENGLTNELYGKFSLGLSVNEVWFLRARK